MRRISSRQNSIVSQYRAAADGQDPARLLLVGTHLVADAIAAGLRLDHMLVLIDALADVDIAPLVSQALAREVDLASATAPVMAAVSPVRSATPIVALAQRPVPDARMFTRPSPFVLVACDIQDPGNLGAIARSAEAASASGLIAAGQSADPFGWKALRGSMGSALRLPIGRQPAEDAVTEARRHGCRIVAAVPTGGRSLFDSTLTGSVAVLIGGEGPGLPDMLIRSADDRLTIPMQRPVESLNAAVTAALIAYEAHRQRS